MSDWRKDLRKVTVGGRKDLIGASFRGVGFFVESSERSGGRRTVVHEFPLRDDPFVEDLGRGARKFPVTGYVIGDDYIVQRDALLVALEDTAGPGELVHPYHGVRRAICASVSVRETKTEGGMATFAIEFIESPAQAPTPTEVVDDASKVAASAAKAVVATRAELVERFSAARMPAFALASAESALTRAADGLQAKLAPVVSGAQELAALAGRVSQITAEASSLVRQPGDAFDAVRAAITGLVDAALAAPEAVLDALLEAYTVDLGPPVVVTTATRERELANQLAITGALRRAIAIEAARIAPIVPYASIEEANAARDRVAAQLEEQAAGAGDTAYPALVTLRSDVLRAVPGAATLASVVTVTRRVAIPSLLLAYQLYGSVDQEADIIARNNISHPGFVAGDLQVLSV